ncbi:hypothetical protein PVAND_015096 [Polypedilum vanderplanki]|uniref:Uncharacterized protein n=1 Tax=Polypedilum vanderplanki TaxID=319348 RepID=A0A9J6BB40_POLVA|nr:hypothetical protein PVAND_015096 [Polypedilum vanderplanki]
MKSIIFVSLLIFIAFVNCEKKEIPHAEIFEQNVICMKETQELENCLKNVKSEDAKSDACGDAKKMMDECIKKSLR